MAQDPLPVQVARVVAVMPRQVERVALVPLTQAAVVDLEILSAALAAPVL